MPKIRWTNLPPIGQHLFDRVADRQIPAEDLYKLKLWRESEPGAPDGPDLVRREPFGDPQRKARTRSAPFSAPPFLDHGDLWMQSCMPGVALAFGIRNLEWIRSLDNGAADL